MSATKAELFDRIRHDSRREGLSFRALARVPRTVRLKYGDFYMPFHSCPACRRSGHRNALTFHVGTPRQP